MIIILCILYLELVKNSSYGNISMYIRGEIMSIYGIRMGIHTVEKELHELEYSTTKEEIRSHGSNVFTLGRAIGGNTFKTKS